MKQNELRIGNYIKFRWAILKVDSINWSGVNLKSEYNRFSNEYFVESRIKYKDFLKPIPLTEEWLLKMGAIEMVKLSDGYVRFDINGIRLSISPDDRDFFIEYVHQIPMKHVHTFQNYYFAVKGEELTIK